MDGWQMIKQGHLPFSYVAAALVVCILFLNHETFLQACRSVGNWSFVATFIIYLGAGLKD